MQINWTHFFWMTGETPQSLSNLVQEVSVNFVPFFMDRNTCKLDLNNQV